MAFGARDYRMIPGALSNMIAEDCRAFLDLSGQLGSAVAIDPAALLHRDIALQPPTHWSANRHCRLVETADSWIAVNLARQEDRDTVSAWLECAAEPDPWRFVIELARIRTSADLLDRAILLGLPVAIVGETAAAETPIAKSVRSLQKPFPEMSVIDLSALWAGPLCAGLLAEAGMVVTKVEDPARPDPTRHATPEHHHRLNRCKRQVRVKLTDALLLDAVAEADILVTSARSHALARLGFTPDALFARNPALIWIAITAHGFYEPHAMRVGFGDDCAAAGGLVRWNAGRPYFLGDALADPLTGLRAAHLALCHLVSGQSGLLDVSLAGSAANFSSRARL
jgi:hypothetical protein